MNLKRVSSLILYLQAIETYSCYNFTNSLKNIILIHGIAIVSKLDILSVVLCIPTLYAYLLAYRETWCLGLHIA